MVKRLLLPTDIPRQLWICEADCLCLPQLLTGKYKEVLARKGLLNCAQHDPSDEGPVGGITESDTQKHFATRFSTSVARAQLAVLDPKEQLAVTSDAFLEAFSGGKISLLDIPCGAGAVSSSLLSTICALRESGAVPRQPLFVKLVAGDLSPYALDYAAEMLSAINDRLVRQGIHVEPIFENWDVLDDRSTTALLYKWIDAAKECREHFVVVANFSGFLQGNNQFRDAQPQLSEVFRWAEQRRSTVMWLEPQTNEALKGLWPRVFAWFQKKLARFFALTQENAEPPLSSQCRYVHPIKAAVNPRVCLSLILLKVNEG